MNLIKILARIFGSRPAPTPEPPSPKVRKVTGSFSGVLTPTGYLRVDNGAKIPIQFDAPYHFIFFLPEDVPAPFGANLMLQAEGLNPIDYRFILSGEPEQVLPLQEFTSPHYDPSGIPLEDLARIRGAMWTARFPLPYGPRPNHPENILDLAQTIMHCPDLKAQAIAAYKARGYTHCVIGPVGNPPYHNTRLPAPWPDSPNFLSNPDAYWDILQELWDNGLAPIVFIKPDNWTSGQLETLTEFYSSPRAQKLCRIVVPGGWEPSMDTSNEEWVKWLSWGSRVFPNALRCIHMVGDFDAPVNNHDGEIGITFQKAWANVAPHVHMFLSQTNGYALSGDNTPSEEFKKNFSSLYSRDFSPSLRNRFERGYAGWPTFSAWGYRGIMVCAAEYAAYISYWDNAPEHFSRELGDLALSVGSYGYLDGGTLPVGSGPIPWAR